MPTKKLFGNAEILHNLPYEAISVTVDKSTTGTVTENATAQRHRRFFV